MRTQGVGMGCFAAPLQGSSEGRAASYLARFSLDGRAWAGLRWPTATSFEPFRPGVSPLAGAGLFRVGSIPTACAVGWRKWRPCRACLGLGDAYPGRWHGVFWGALPGLERRAGRFIPGAVLIGWPAVGGAALAYGYFL